MPRTLFISNGHGETAIAARIARDVRALAATAALDLFAAVGTGAGAAPLAVVGPRQTMPSGGLVAMGNVRAFARDLGAGFAGLLAAQLRFLRGAGAHYDLAVAVGDVYALGLAFVTGLPAMYVGTAKSVYVAPYGPFERTLLRRALRIFVRDEATAARLREQRVPAQAPGNVIVDLAPGDGAEIAAFAQGPSIGMLPGSRSDAYGNAVRLARVVRALGGREPACGMLSIAPTLDAAAFARELAADGWTIEAGSAEPAFVARANGTIVVGSGSNLGTLLARASIVVGQAGTANEQAAARGIPVVALDDPAQSGWYRMRQRRLLGDAIAIVPGDPEAAAAAIAALLADPSRMAAMARAGRERMGPPGGSAAIAQAIVAFG
jgi:uncharacterized protein (TIGR03492 family)